MSKIEWTEQTWNPLAGCTEISPGCTNCYAAVMAHRLEAMGQKKYAGTTRKAASGKVTWTGKINLDEAALQDPLKRKKPTTYFVNSMSDLFHEDVPDRFIEDVFCVMAQAHWHTFQVLTKRAERMPRWFKTLECVGLGYDGNARDRGKIMVSGIEYDWPLRNVWIGVSVENQKYADERIPHLLKTPATVRFLSCEPLLGPVDLAAHMNSKKGFFANVDSLECCGKTYPKRGDIDWVIVGGESGHGARPMFSGWVRLIRDQCVRAGVPFFFKQWGEWGIGGANAVCVGDDGICPTGRGLMCTIKDINHNHTLMSRYGKKAAGRILDGREWNYMPKAVRS